MNRKELSKACSNLETLIQHLASVKDVVSVKLTTPVNVNSDKSAIPPPLPPQPGNTQTVNQDAFYDNVASDATLAGQVSMYDMAHNDTHVVDFPEIFHDTADGTGTSVHLQAALYDQAKQDGDVNVELQTALYDEADQEDNINPSVDQEPQMYDMAGQNVTVMNENMDQLADNSGGMGIDVDAQEGTSNPAAFCNNSNM